MSVNDPRIADPPPEAVFGRFQLTESFQFDPSEAASAIAKAADIAVVLDGEGVVVDVAINAAELARLGVRLWIGRPFMEMVTPESRAKVQPLLARESAGLRRWRQVNHSVDARADVPVEYAVIHAGDDGVRILAGRELSAIAAMQQRLIAAQADIEREFGRVRSAEARYRMLFQVASEAVLIVDAVTERVVEANPAAAELFDAKSSRLPSIAAASLFEPSDVPKLHALYAAVRASGGTDSATVRSSSGRPLDVAVSIFLQGNKSYFLLRAEGGDPTSAGVRSSAELIDMIDRLPEGFVVCDGATRVISANAAFVEMTQQASIEQLRGHTLSNWIGRTGVDTDALFSSLRQQQSVRGFITLVRGALGTDDEVEIAGVAVTAPPGEPRFGMMVRIVRPWVVPAVAGLERSVERMTELVGRVPLRDLVRETTDMIERLCIEAALKLSDNNRVGAAEMLGLSRQSLYVKMRRFDQLAPGLDDDAETR